MPYKMSINVLLSRSLVCLSCMFNNELMAVIIYVYKLGRLCVCDQKIKKVSISNRCSFMNLFTEILKGDIMIII